MYCREHHSITPTTYIARTDPGDWVIAAKKINIIALQPVSYTHLRAHETPEHLVCRLLLEKKKEKRVFFLRKHLAVIDLLEGLSLVGTYFRRYRQSYRQS